MKKKIKNNKEGASLISVILALSLTSALAIFVSNQIIKQIKSTTNRANEIQLQYTSEAGIERVIEELDSKLKSSTTKNSVSLNTTRNREASNLDLIRQEVNGIKQIDNVDTSELETAIADIDYTANIDSIILKLSNVRTELLNIVKDNASQRKK